MTTTCKRYTPITAPFSDSTEAFEAWDKNQFWYGGRLDRDYPLKSDNDDILENKYAVAYAQEIRRAIINNVLLCDKHTGKERIQKFLDNPRFRSAEFIIRARDQMLYEAIFRRPQGAHMIAEAPTPHK